MIGWTPQPPQKRATRDHSHVKRPTATQRLGEVVLRGGRFDAIRFPSKAMRAVGKTGINLVIAEAAALDPAMVAAADYGDPKA